MSNVYFFRVVGRFPYSLFKEMAKNHSAESMQSLGSCGCTAHSCICLDLSLPVHAAAGETLESAHREEICSQANQGNDSGAYIYCLEAKAWYQGTHAVWSYADTQIQEYEIGRGCNANLAGWCTVHC